MSFSSFRVSFLDLKRDPVVGWENGFTVRGAGGLRDFHSKENQGDAFAVLGHLNNLETAVRMKRLSRVGFRLDVHMGLARSRMEDCLLIPGLRLIVVHRLYSNSGGDRVVAG